MTSVNNRLYYGRSHRQHELYFIQISPQSQQYAPVLYSSFLVMVARKQVLGSFHFIRSSLSIKMLDTNFEDAHYQFHIQHSRSGFLKSQPRDLLPLAFVQFIFI